MTEHERQNEISYLNVRIQAIDRSLRDLPADSKARMGLERSREEALREIGKLEK